MSNTPRIRLVITRSDGRNTDITISGKLVTVDMLDVAEELRDTLTTGERPPLKGFYDLCAQAFGTTRSIAKKKLIAAMYGAGRKNAS